jgi:hypothetical protein
VQTIDAATAAANTFSSIEEAVGWFGAGFSITTP